MNLYIYSYNNYYNRQYKKAGDNIDDYVEFLIYGPVQGVYGFTPGNGVNTTQIIGSNAQMYDGKGDYLIAHDPQTNEMTRWFIIDTNRTRDGQWSLTLHRDLLADYYQEALEADCYIEKANLVATSNFIYNAENIAVNQIKTDETLLKDESNSAWLTIYYAKDATDLNGTVDILNEDVDSIPINAPTIQDWQYFKYTEEDMLADTYDGYYTAKVRGLRLVSTYIYADYSINSSTGDTYISKVSLNTNNTENRTLYNQYITDESTLNEQVNFIENAYREKGIQLFDPRQTIGQASQEDIDYILSLQGKTVKTEDGKFYRISITQKKFTDRIVKITNDTPSIFNNLSNLFTVDLGYQGSANNDTFTYTFDGTLFRISYTELSNLNVTYDITSGQRLLTEDAPWNICAIPYGEVTVKNDTTDETIVVTDKEVGLALASAIQLQNSGSGATKIYDVQLLPYCPVASLITDKGELTVSNEAQYSLVKQGDNVKGIIFNVPFSTFSLTINHKIRKGLRSIETKLNQICDKWRLASPNYSSYFDFSVEMNKGVDFFDVDCNYKPFTPYIHINPNFRGLYGYDDNSPRGLILGGDFSISQIIDQWESYQIQNKNFQNIFDRQITYMDTQHEIQRKREGWAIAGGALSGAASGALIGSMVAPGFGTVAGIVGGVAGGLASAGTGVADLAYNNKLRDAAKSYTQDMYKLQLDNIQALPQTISKVSAYNQNNKIFPVLEYYTCTNEEKFAVLNKIAWNGMTINVPGKLKDYIYNTWKYTFQGIQFSSKNYIKAQLIRIDLETEHFDVVNALAEELYKGIYIT